MTSEVEAPASAPAPGVPDYMLNPDAVLKDEATWRHGSAPDYSPTRKIWAETKKHNHAPGSLDSMVENLVKNWEIEASHKMKLTDWRTIDHSKYTFAINGGAPQDGEHMLKVGTYNAIITPNQYYDPGKTDFDKSHQVFRDMMPNFAWEVVEVYSPPPVVAFRWRHWGQMKRDYVGWNDKNEEVRIKAHGNYLDIQGVTVAKLNDAMKVTGLETWFDPVDMFIQMKPDLSNAEVEVDGKTLSAEETVSILEHPHDSGVEKVLDEVSSDQNQQSVAERLGGSGAGITGRDDVHLHHPSAPAESDQMHSEDRVDDGQTALAGEEIAAIPERPKERGVEKVRDEVPTDQQQQQQPVTEGVTGNESTMTDEDNVHIHQPSIPERPHPGDSTNDAQSLPAGHPETTSDAGACPFMALGQRG